MEESVTIPKEEYDKLLKKVDLFERLLESEELSKEEVKKVKTALEGSFLSKEEFLRKHPELEG